MVQQIPQDNVLRHFFGNSSKVSLSALGEGNINDTFLARSPQKSLVLQRINHSVFPDPQILIRNLHHLTIHFKSLPHLTGQRWEDAILIPTLDGSTSVRDNQGAVWRALSYIDDSICFSHVKTTLQAEQTGWALGHFHKRLIGLAVENMEVPLPGFHNLEGYLTQYEQIIDEPRVNEPLNVKHCLEIITEYRDEALILARTHAGRSENPGIIHGDPKIGNVLFSKKSGLAISLIDLDTVGPGLLHHDIGDCLRSVCNKGGETGRSDTVTFDLDLCRHALSGYFKAGGTLRTERDKKLIYNSITAITYELGLRFFIDYLQGGTYFKSNTLEETLEKSLVQFSLFFDIVRKKEAINEIIRESSRGDEVHHIHNS